MSLRDKILNTDGDFQSETIDVPEWGVKLVMRELSVADRGKVTFDSFEQVEVAGGWVLKPKFDAIAAAHIVVLSAYDEDGSLVFVDDDADTLAKRAFSVVHRLAQITRRLSGLLDEDGEDEGKAPAEGSSATPPDRDSSNSPTT